MLAEPILARSGDHPRQIAILWFCRMLSMESSGSPSRCSSAARVRAIAESWGRKGSGGSGLSLRSDNLDSVGELYTEEIFGNGLWPLRRRQLFSTASANRTRGQRTATRPMPGRSGRCPWRTNRRRPSSVSSSAWQLSMLETSASTACARSARAPLRKTSLSGSVKVPG
jgi:hypothetical protein